MKLRALLVACLGLLLTGQDYNVPFRPQEPAGGGGGAPVVEACTNGVQGSGDPTTVDVSGLSLAEGDLVILIAGVDNATNWAATQTNLSVIGLQQIGATNDLGDTIVAWEIQPETPRSSYSLAHADGAAGASWVVCRISGTHATTPIAGSASQGNDNSVTVTFPACASCGGADRIALRLAALDGAASQTISAYPHTGTHRQFQAGAAGDSGAIGDHTTATTDPGSATATIGDDEDSGAWTVVIQPP